MSIANHLPASPAAAAVAPGTRRNATGLDANQRPTIVRPANPSHGLFPGWGPRF